MVKSRIYLEVTTKGEKADALSRLLVAQDPGVWHGLGLQSGEEWRERIIPDTKQEITQALKTVRKICDKFGVTFAGNPEVKERDFARWRTECGTEKPYVNVQLTRKCTP
jgi:hypothetical protein